MKRWIIIFVCMAASLSGGQALAHEVRPAYLELRETSAGVYEVLWKVPARGEMRLGIDVRMPKAAEQLTPPSGRFVDDAYIERWQVRCSGGLAGEVIAVDGLAATKIDVLVRVQHADGGMQTARLLPGSPRFTVASRPSGWVVSGIYFRLGVEHILLGVDHLLFVLGLLLLVDRRWMLVKTITSFTVAHSITLALSSFAILRVPEAPLNACIALSILFLGPEVVRKWRGQTSLTIRHPWVVAFAFGLLHGVGFASGLSLTGLPRAEIPSALLFFNVGVEAGQLAFVLAALAVAAAIRSLQLDEPRWVARVPAYTVGSLGAFWTIQRVSMMFQP